MTPEWTGSYNPPGTDDLYEAKLSPDERDHWNLYMYTVMAVIDSGAVDSLIYEVAMKCHERHIITGGRATGARPARPTAGQRITPDQVKPHLIISNGNPIPQDANVSPYFTYDGRRYGKNRCVGRFFTLPSGTAFPRVEGAFVKIEEAGNVAFTVTVVNHPDNADRIGDKLKIRFSDVPQFFGA